MKTSTPHTIQKAFALCALLLAPLALYASTTSGSIDVSFKLTKICKDATCTSFGNVNWKPTLNAMTPGATAVTITDTAITGHIWSDEIGWIRLAQTGLTGPQTLKVNPATGVVTGFAYASVGGWINFSPTQATTSTTTVGVTINSVGEFIGWAWASGAYGGWMKFDCGGVGTCIKTDWRPIPHREACQNGIDDDSDGLIDLADAGCTAATGTSEVNTVTPPSGGGGGGGGFGGVTPPGVVNNASNPPTATTQNTNTVPNNANTAPRSVRTLPAYVPENINTVNEKENVPSVPNVLAPQVKVSEFSFGIIQKPIPAVVRTIVDGTGISRTLSVTEIPLRTKLTRNMQSSRIIASVENTFIRTNDIANYKQKVIYGKQTLWQWLTKKLLLSIATPAYAEETYVDTIETPTESGLYNLESNVRYTDGTQEKMAKEVSVLPQGNIFYRPAFFFSNEIMIDGAKVELYRKDEVTGTFVLAPLANTYDNVNTIQTDKSGEYVFNVNRGTYVVRVTKDSFIASETAPLEVLQDAQVLNDRIELVYASWWPLASAWDVKILILIVLGFFFGRNYHKNTKKNKK